MTNAKPIPQYDADTDALRASTERRQVQEAQEEGKLRTIKNGSGVPCYVFRWYEILPDGTRARRKREVSKVESMTREQAQKTVDIWNLVGLKSRVGVHPIQTMGDLIAHFRAKEMVDKGDDGRAWSTRDRYTTYLDNWIEPRWGKETLDSIVPGEVEDWLHSLKRDPKRGKRNKPQASVDDKDKVPLAAGTKEKIRDIMSILFNHAIRWKIYPANPISGPARRSGVRQGGKREKIPDTLEIDEMRAILAELGIRERAMASLEMLTGLRRGELAGLKWSDIDFANLLVNVVRSVVDQVTGRCKTELSAKPQPIDPYTAQDLLTWYRVTPYRDPEDWVWASDSPKLGGLRGKQPLWLAKVMKHHIQPLIRRLGINKRVTWHTFRHTFTTLLTANGEDVKVVQELLRHGTPITTLSKYAQARMPAKRQAQQRLAESLHQTQAPEPASSSDGAKRLQQRGRAQRMRVIRSRRCWSQGGPRTVPSPQGGTLSS